MSSDEDDIFDQWFNRGQRLGLKERDLLDWIGKQMKDVQERKERAESRRLEKIKLEAEKVKLETEKEENKLKLEAEKVRIEAERGKKVNVRN